MANSGIQNSLHVINVFPCSVKIPSIGTADSACLALNKAEIIGDTTALNIKLSKVEDHRTLILEQFAVRHGEISKQLANGLRNSLTYVHT